MDNLNELPSELAPVLADLLQAAKGDPLLGKLPAPRLEAELRESLMVSLQPISELIDAIHKANAARGVALRELTTNPSESASLAVSRAAMQAEGAQLGLVELKKHVLERARFIYSASFIDSRVEAAGYAACLAGPTGLLASQLKAAEGLDDALDALSIVAETYKAAHEATCRTARDFAGTAIKRFDPPHPLWSLERRDDVTSAFDVAKHNVMELILQRLDGIFRPWGGCWTSNTQLRYIDRSDAISDAQADRNAKAYGTLCGTAQQFGVQVPGNE